MQDFQKRRGYRPQLVRMALGAFGVVLLFVVAYFAVRGAWHMYGKFTQAAAAHEAGEARLVQLRQEHDRAVQRVEELRTDRGVEAELRERYGLSRPGEGEIVVVRPPADAAGAAAGSGLLDKLWKALFVW